METETIKALVLECLMGVAPELDPKDFKPDVEFREQIDIDSMDMLNFVTALHQRTGIDVPDADFIQLNTLDACAAYLTKRMPD